MRGLVLAAAAILAFDGVAVIGVGLLSHRPLFTTIGGVLAVAAVVTLASWRWHQSRLDQIRRDKQGLRDELRAIDDFLQRP